MCDLDKMIQFLKREDFYELVYSSDEEVTSLFLECLYRNNTFFLKRLKTLIQEDENIFLNLLYLMPFSNRIVEEILKKEFLDSIELEKRIEIVFNTSLAINDFIKREKSFLKEQKDLIGGIKQKLEYLIKEIEKNEDYLKELKLKKEKESELKSIKQEIKKIEEEFNIEKIEELKEKLEEYRKIRDEINKIKKEVNESRKIFSNLCKDEL